MKKLVAIILSILVAAFLCFCLFGSMLSVTNDEPIELTEQYKEVLD